jgi:hypothetical protein
MLEDEMNMAQQPTLVDFEPWAKTQDWSALYV